MAFAFDPIYYMGQRSDVFTYYVNAGAQAGTGMDWNAFAENHYNNFGWKEGTNPNGQFNTLWYLQNNLDVAAAGVNPFQHYLTHGVYEGRAPSASFPKLGVEFDADAYLAANPDLEENGIDTPEAAYAHFVLHGQFENRPGAPVVDNNPGQTFTLTNAIGETVTGTDGNDTITGVVGDGNTGTFQFGDQVDGGAGTDTLNLFMTGAPTGLPAGTSVRNVEIININGDIGTAINSNAFVGAEQIWQIGAARNVTNLSADQTAGFRNTTVSHTVSVANGVDTLNVQLDNIGTGSTVALGEATAGDLTTVNVSGSVAGAGALTLSTLGSTEIETINLSLTSDSTITMNGAFFAELETINAAGSEGDLVINLATGFAELASVSTGSGDDVVTLGGQDDVTVVLGAGDDTLNLDGDEAGLSITLGSGVDAVVFGDVNNIVDASKAKFAESIISITDFNAADDELDLSSFTVNLLTLSNTDRKSVESAETLYDALVAAGSLTATSGTDGDAIIFKYGGNTYIYINGDASSNGFDAGDGVIELVGFSGSLTEGVNLIV